MIKLNELEVYKVALEIGEIVWAIVEKWSFFEKDTLGKQFTRAADSIAFNISEGYGRFHYAENRNFCYYSRGSAYERLQQLQKQKSESYYLIKNICS
ncbi:MAG: four helix bundle protein [Segetibacter sp.]